MSYTKKQCKLVMKDLAKYDNLSAVERTHVDMHIRRCDSCQNISSTFNIINDFKMETTLTDENKDTIFDRLVPSVQEIATTTIEQKKSSVSFLPYYSAAGALAAAAVIWLIVGAGLFNNTPEHGIAGFNIPSQQDDNRSYIDTRIHVGTADLVQGNVIINGESSLSNDGAFLLEDSSNIQVGKNSKFKFRMGESVEVALLENSDWNVDSITDEKIKLELNKGKLAIEYDGTSGRILEVKTPQLTVIVKGTIFTVEVFDDGVTQVAVSRGEVKVVPDNGTPMKIASNQLWQVPGAAPVVNIGDQQMMLASMVEDSSDGLVATSGRLVKFEGEQSLVKVEVDDKFIGYTPLVARLQRGPVKYRLTKPGMEVIEAELNNEQVDEQVVVSMVPSNNYVPAVVLRGYNPGKAGNKVNALESEDLDKSCRNVIARAKAAMASGNILYATDLLKKTSLKVKGEAKVEALSLLGECYAATGEYLMAADTFQEVVSLVPASRVGQNSRYEVARLAMNHIGDFNRARSAFTAYVASPVGGPLKEDAYFSLCELEGRRGARQTAMRCFNEYLQMFPDGPKSPLAYMWRGVLHQELGQKWKTAERDLLSFIEARPRHPRCEEARYRIALGRYHISDFKGAIKMFDEYMKEHPSGQYRIRIERLKQAIYNKNK